jgi:hypothetical protein
MHKTGAFGHRTKISGLERNALVNAAAAFLAGHATHLRRSAASAKPDKTIPINPLLH